MRIHLLVFGVLKQSLGATTEVVLPDGATVADLLGEVRSNAAIGSEVPDLGSIAVGVNAVYVQSSHVLHDDDEVALLPPVSGGSGQDSELQNAGQVFLTRNPIDAYSLVAAAKHGQDGAVVVFDGIVRNNSRGRRTLYLDYESYEEMALKQLNELAAEARNKFTVRHATIVHRLGRLDVGETSVLIVVASAHRAQAYEASRWMIDTLKKTVPIWKKETFVDGAVWADGEPFPAEIAVSQTEAKHEN
jgi:molybdopterin synthase catalytic subunit